MVRQMLAEAIDVELQFCQDALSQGITGLSPAQMADYLRYCADQRLVQLGYKAQYHTTNPFPFMTLQDVQPLTNFFEKRVTEYQKGLDVKSDELSFSEAF
jgi:ribonucleoside-diphosphate reductase beta chain